MCPLRRCSSALSKPIRVARIVASATMRIAVMSATPALSLRTRNRRWPHSVHLDQARDLAEILELAACHHLDRQRAQTCDRKRVRHSAAAIAPATASGCP